MVGQIGGVLLLSRVSIATSFTSVTGFSILITVRLYRCCIGNQFIILAKCHLAGLYMKYSSACMETRGVFSREVLLSLNIFFRFAIPSALMTWYFLASFFLLFFIVIFCSLLLLNFKVTYLHYFIPYAFGATASTRVSNELGAGNPESAKMAIWIILCIAAAEIITVSTILLRCRNFVGYAFSSEKQIADHVADMAPLICLSVIVDSLQAVLSG
ncbi:hypothetical protein L6164_017331 [Bauhinia variegata]|uniref:Uncharacterized protein n=1 Tax=Bauhinia variegata TaxID=167791 RepID=A0ACB9N7S0_BAUVA|nr:hypothetical protein L6164_017331 [Bauhinia variegata]